MVETAGGAPSSKCNHNDCFHPATLQACAHVRRANLVTPRANALCVTECHFGDMVLDGKMKCNSALMTTTIQIFRNGYSFITKRNAYLEGSLQ